MNKLVKDAALLGTAFFLVFVALHGLSDSVSVRLPFLASSEAIWEHMKMAFYAALLAYPLIALGGRRVGIAGFSLTAFMAVFVVFTLYYSVVSVIGPLSRFGLAVDLSVVIPLTWLSGFIASVVGLWGDGCLNTSKLINAILLALLIGLAWLTITTTYLGPPFPLFTLPK